jgi:hypothetical protein
MKVIYYKGNRIEGKDLQILQKCDVCGKESIKMWSMQGKHSCCDEHQKMVQNIITQKKIDLKEKGTCPYCNKYCRSQMMLGNHILAIHPEKAKEHFKKILN